MDVEDTLKQDYSDDSEKCLQGTYVLNTNKRKIHKSNYSSVLEISGNHIEYINKSINEYIV